MERHGDERPRLVNMYGITETTVHVTYRPITRADVEAERGSVIGRAIPDLRIYLLDAHGQPVPVGVAGEMYVGGAGVARGYLNRDELTRERFLEDPFRAGERVYRSGDLARYRADGELEYLGRADEQVKVRGFRIEPGEVEAALLAQEGVREAVVVVRGEGAEQRLVAYVTGEVEVAGVREGVRERLPEHMVPAAIVVLESIPLTPNGKTDRKALPEPEWGVRGEAYVAPRTVTEEVLAGIWAEVLGVERVGVGENFFDLGGHSLLATRVVARAQAALGTEIPLRAIFEAPTVAGLAEQVEAALRAGAGVQAPPIVRVPRDGSPLPLSFAQARLWFIDQLQPGSAAYNVPVPLRVRGAVDARALAAALSELARRHEALRTVFRATEGEPVQVVLPASSSPLPTVDLRALSPEAREIETGRLAAEDAARPFDLARGPLLRTTLVRSGEGELALLVNMHHVVSDEWSLEIFFRELSALYEAFAAGASSPLAELPVQYADFAVWQRAWLSGGTLEEQVGFWREQLGGAPPLLEIPTDRPRAPGQSARGGIHPFTLSAEVTQGLRALSRREGTTLFMTVLAGWQALLGRYAGQEDVVVGTPIAGRTRAEVEGLIGFFVNMLALRADLGGDPTWAELLGRTRATALGAYAHQDLPFERLVDELDVERSLMHAPLFQVIFALHRPGGDERLSLGEVQLLEASGGRERAVKFDLTLNMVEGEEGLGAAILYREALFDAAMVARMATHLEVLLEGLAANPERRLSEVPLLRGAERAQLLHAWNGADTGYTGELCIHELFHAQVLRIPDAPALSFHGRTLSYAALYHGACRLARRLRREGVGPETRVGICMEPAPEMIVSVLGVLLAGGAYLPLDPDLPSERRAYMLRDAAPALLLTQAGLAERLADTGVPLLQVDAEAGRIAQESDRAPETGVGPDNLAYVIYTSGSTGRPKGVLVAHRGVGNTLLELGRVYGVGPGDRNLLFAPLYFDSSVAEMFVALCNGAELVVTRREDVLPGEDLLRTLREERITHVKTMPSALAVTPVEPLPELRSIGTGGEKLPAEVVRRWGAGRRFLSGYGATEASIRMAATAYTCEDGRDPPVGHPVPNTQLYVLDRWLEPAPVGVAGELYIGGVGVVRGYLGRPELTAERFVPDPHRGVAGARLYRTGDVGRRRADGEIEFLGRTDHQVKVRGYRVELGEIEAVLRGHEQVREAVVLLREDVPGQQRLVAYVTAKDGAEPRAAELREHAGEQLPEYMVPSAVVVL
ncbi:MAG TPA: amino acid adenylation domain-containing protein, partial [Longimicrobiaceae bacterium]